MRVIEEIVKKVEQGYSNPYECRVEDELFIIKGLPRSSQLKEWISGNLALKFGLPIADFELLDLPYELVDILDDEAKQHLGCGPVFGSKVIDKARWFEPNTSSDIVSDKDKLNIFLFDYWVRNSDRNSGNTNLLIGHEGVVVIDHNEAFRTDYTLEDLKSHLFFDQIDSNYFNDLVFRSNLEKKMSEILLDYDGILASIPEYWDYLDPPDNTVASTVDYNWIKETLFRHENDEFWPLLCKK